MKPKFDSNSPAKDLSRCDSINSSLYSYSIPGVCPFCGHKTDPKKMIRGRDDGLCLRRIFIAVGRYIRWFYSYSSGGAFGTLTRPWLITRRHKYLKLLAIHHCHGKLHKEAPSSNYRRRVSSTAVIGWKHFKFLINKRLRNKWTPPLWRESLLRKFLLQCVILLLMVRKPSSTSHRNMKGDWENFALFAVLVEQWIWNVSFFYWDSQDFCIGCINK